MTTAKVSTRAVRDVENGDARSPFPLSLLGLSVDEILFGPDDDPELCVARAVSGHPWLVARGAPADGAAAGRWWIGAPASTLAIDCVRRGRADPADAFCHSLTGSVVVVTLSGEGECSESVQLCREFRDHEFRVARGHLAGPQVGSHATSRAEGHSCAFGGSFAPGSRESGPESATPRCSKP